VERVVIVDEGLRLMLAEGSMFRPKWQRNIP
jgi:hypothetical protein